MQIKYVGPFDAVELDGVGVVAQGAAIDVSADLAGKAPDSRILAAHAELAEAIAALDHVGAAALREEIIGLDAGAGLLSQPDNWQPANIKPTKPAPSDEGAQP